MMPDVRKRKNCWQRALFVAALGLVPAAIGCQIEVGGQTLPSPYYLSDDVQYFPQGAEFKLAREAEVQRAFREDEALRAAAATNREPQQ